MEYQVCAIPLFYIIYNRFLIRYIFKSPYIVYIHIPIAKLLYLTDIYCLPSYREGMPRSIIEAMAMNCAIIATDIRGSREEVDHNKNGFLVELGNVLELKNTIEILCDDAVKIEKFKYNARLKALNEYNEKDVVEKQLRIFDSFRS